MSSIGELSLANTGYTDGVKRRKQKQILGDSGVASRLRRKAAMEKLVGIRPNLSGDGESLQTIRALRVGSRLDRLRVLATEAMPFPMPARSSEL